MASVVPSSEDITSRTPPTGTAAIARLASRSGPGHAVARASIVLSTFRVDRSRAIKFPPSPSFGMGAKGRLDGGHHVPGVDLLRDLAALLHLVQQDGPDQPARLDGLAC